MKSWKWLAGMAVAGLMLGAALFFGWPLLADVASPFLSLGMDPNEPQLLVTAEYMTVDELTSPKAMDVAKRHKLWVAPCIRAGHLDADLDRLYTAYEKAGVKIVFWPLLPREQCLYLNKQHAEDYMNMLDQIYAWAEKYNHKIEAMVVDIEPPNCQKGTDLAPEAPPANTGLGIGEVVNQLDKKEFEKTIPKFEAVIKKLHDHGTVAISTAMDYAAVDIDTGRPVFQDLSGGPSLIVNWDMVSFMNFGSQNQKFLSELMSGLHVKWEIKDTRYLSYIMCRLISGKFGNRAAISMGQTIPGEGHGAVWTDPADLGRDAAVCKAAGILHFGIYDFQGIVNSPDPDAWIMAVKNAKPAKPEYSAKAVCLWNTIKALTVYGEMKRSW